VIGKISRTWWRQNSDGKFFRNCPAVEMDLARPLNKLPSRCKKLTAEWQHIFRAGITRADAIPKGDRWLPWDDSPEATGRWVKNLLATYGHPTC
jgi:hypothetical protein